MTETQNLARAFAGAIAKPGGNAMLITEAGRKDRWVPIDEAVDSGRAFLVEPRQGVIALDIDTAQDWAWAERARDALEESGCRFVLTASGRPGHGHMWVIAPPGWTNKYTKLRVYEAAGQHDRSQARADNGTRPPYSPHRSMPIRSTVVEPDPQTALSWFRETHRREIPESQRARLRWFNPSTAALHKGTPSRSLTIGRVAVAMVNARWTFEDFLAELRDRSNETASKYREMAPGLRDDWAESVWQEATEFVRTAPPRTPAQVARERLNPLLTCMNDLDWPARTGANDRAVYRALLGIGLSAGSVEVSASIRQLSDLAALSKNGVTAALKRLGDRGLIRRTRTAEGGHAATYRVAGWGAQPGGPPGVLFGGGAEAGASADSTPSDRAESAVPRTISSPLRGDQGLVMVRTTALLADIFTNGTGLGLSCRETWEALPTTPTTTAEAVGLRPGALRHRTVRGHLNTLAAHGLAERTGSRWSRVVPSVGSLTFLANHLGVRNKLARRAERNAAEAALFREQLKEWGIDAPTGRERGNVA